MQTFKYYNWFIEGKEYTFLHPLGWEFKSEVKKDGSGETYYTTNPNEQQFKASSLKCKKPKSNFTLGFYWAKTFQRNFYYCNKKNTYFYLGHRYPKKCCDLIHEFVPTPTQVEILLNELR